MQLEQRGEIREGKNVVRSVPEIRFGFWWLKTDFSTRSGGFCSKISFFHRSQHPHKPALCAAVEKKDPRSDTVQTGRLHGRVRGQRRGEGGGLFIALLHYGPSSVHDLLSLFWVFTLAYFIPYSLFMPVLGEGPGFRCHVRLVIPATASA